MDATASVYFRAGAQVSNQRPGVYLQMPLYLRSMLLSTGKPIAAMTLVLACHCVCTQRRRLPVGVAAAGGASWHLA